MKHKLLSILLCLAMALSLLPTAALAEEATGAGPIKVGNASYESFSDAVNAAEPDGSGVITYEISGKVDVTATDWVQVARAGLTTLNEVKFVGKTEDAEICITQGKAILADQNYDIDVSFEALKLTKLNPQWADDFGHSTNYFTCWLRNTNAAENTVTYTNCTFPNGVCNNQYGKTVFNNCKFTNNTAGLSNLWNYGGETKVEECTFTGTRGNKMYNEGTLQNPPSIEIENTSFTGMTEKAAIVVSKAANVTLNTVGATGCTKGLLQKDIEGSTDEQKVTIEANGTGISGDFNITGKKDAEAAKNEFNITAGTFPGGINNDYLAPGANFDATTGEVKMSYVAKIGDTEYPTLAEAITAAGNGDTIKLLKDVTDGDGVIVPSGKNFTLDFDNHTYTVTQNLAGSTGTKNQCFQLLKDSTLTFKNGTIKANNGNVAMIIQNYSNLTLENMLLDGASITRNDVIIYTMSNNCGNVEIKDTKINTVPNGVAFDVYGGFGDYSDVTVTVTGSSEINGKIEVARDSGMQNKNTLNINGGTINGELKIDSSIKPGDATAITKTENVSLPAPSGYTWTKVGNTGVLVKEDSAAVVNGVGYTTLAAAINAAGNDDTVTLLKDVTENVTIPAGKTITLDLNGKKLTNANGEDTITVALGASLTVTGSGTVDNVTHGKADIYNNGTVILNGGSYTRSQEKGVDKDNSGGNSYYNILNHGIMTIGENVSVTSSGHFSSLIANGYYNYSAKDPRSGYVSGTNQESPKLTINGGTFSGGINTIKNDDNATLIINDGSFSNVTQAVVQNNHVATINGGTFDANAYHAIENRHFDGGHNTGSVTVTSGTFTGGLYTTTGATWSITGGSFSTDLKNTGYLADSVSAEVKSADGSTYSYYTSMNDALAAAKPGDTVTDLKAATEQKVTLTLKYNDGATADTTYNVASGTTITLPTPKRSGYTFNGWYDGSTKVSSSYKVTKNVTLTASWSYNYSGGSSSYDPTYSVSTPSKTENGSVTVSPKNASKGDTVTVTVKPDSGYVLETLTVTDKNGNELTLKDKGNGKYTFTMPAGKVEVKATFMEDNSMLNFFYDVPNNAYFYEAVKWAVKNGITTGVGNDLFAPEQPCTRAQIVTFLWRAAGSPEPKGAASGMTDVVSGSYYEKAVAWAIENGITTGTTTSTFSPDATCTRAQAVTFLARALNAKAASAAEFSDVPTDSYFADAVAWAAANGVTEGIGGGLFGSDNDCTRGQIVTFLYRAYNK